MDKNNQKTMLAVIAGIVDPVLKKWAQQLAALVPEHSAVRTEIFESVIGAFKGFIETKAEQLSPVAGVAVEKATDFGDFFSGALGSPGLDLEKWASEVLNDAGERLRNAEDPAAELERIKLELKLRKELVEIIKAELPSSPQSIVDWQEIDKQAAATLTGINKKMEEWLPQVKKWAKKGDRNHA